MRLKIDDQFGRRKQLIARTALRLLASGRFRSYHPVIVNGRRLTGSARAADHRLDAALPLFAELGVATVNDLGAAEGYVARRCAEAGYATLGIEPDLRRLMLAQWSTALDGLPNIGFWRMELTPDTARWLPEADATICMSLLHHLVYAEGEDYGRALLEAIRARTRTVMIFEMGQSNETSSAWSQHLPDMGTDPHEWIADYLRSAGFTDVRKLCETPGWESDIRRATFAAFTTDL